MTAEDLKNYLKDVASKLGKDYAQVRKSSVTCQVGYEDLLDSMAMLSATIDSDVKSECKSLERYRSGIMNKTVLTDKNDFIVFETTFDNDSFVFISCRGKKYLVKEDQHLYDLEEYRQLANAMASVFGK